MHMDSGLGELEAQLASKEREWKELLASRDRQLESSLSEAQEECLSLRERYQKLREDFQFNLAILDERDLELERSDVLAARALSEESDRQRELKSLRVLVLQLEKQRDRDAVETQQQLDEQQRSAAAESQRLTEEHERMKRDLQCRIQEVEGELSLQRQETTDASACRLTEQQHFSLKMESMGAVLQSCQLKLVSETEAHLQAQRESKEALRASEELCQQLQRQLHHKRHQMEDLAAVKDHKIKDLEDELKWMETKMKKEREDHMKKCEEAAQAQKECQAQLEAVAAQLHRIQKEQQEAKQQTGQTIHRLRKELEAAQTGWDKYVRQVSREMVVKETEILSLHERESKLKTESERSREEMQRYRQQLSDGLKRERALEQMQVQLEVEWQSRCEDMKAQHYLSNEQLIQDLTAARDQAAAELKERKQDLQDLTVLLRCVETERDQAVQGLTPKADSLALEEIRGLQQQNSVLRDVVTHMRKDMEGLIHLQPHHQAMPQASSPQPGQNPGPPAGVAIPSTADPQRPTGPPDQSTNISFKVGPGGGLCWEESGHASTWAKQEFSPEHSESAPADVTEQRGRSGAGLRREPPLLRSRLKRAASCIARLSREKQQLIEMGNRLRAQVTTAGPQGAAAPVDPEKPREQRDRLLALERLQYQLTTQELQYALMQRPGPLAAPLLPGTNHPGPTTEGPANPWSRGHKTRDRPETSLSPQDRESRLSQSQGPLDVELSGCRLSSDGSLRSLKELWEILDGGLSPSIVSEELDPAQTFPGRPLPGLLRRFKGEGELSGKKLADSGDAGVQMTVFGRCAPIHGLPPSAVQPRKCPPKSPSNPTKTSKPAPTGRTCTIRNYNVKD
ncbi:coiled-coil domain-containing protein 57 isoform X3 [Gasterosteus aculeatus]